MEMYFGQGKMLYEHEMLVFISSNDPHVPRLYLSELILSMIEIQQLVSVGKSVSKYFKITNYTFVASAYQIYSHADKTFSSTSQYSVIYSSLRSCSLAQFIL